MTDGTGTKVENRFLSGPKTSFTEESSIKGGNLSHLCRVFPNAKPLSLGSTVVTPNGTWSIPENPKNTLVPLSLRRFYSNSERERNISQRTSDDESEHTLSRKNERQSDSQKCQLPPAIKTRGSPGKAFYNNTWIFPIG